jgi:hypothetical protein
MTHTPGPWKCASAKFPDEHDIQEYGDTGAFYLVDTQDGGMPISLANANLIAAAPEMYGALRELDKAILAVSGYHLGMLSPAAATTLRQVIYEVIAKAEGKE